MHSDLSLMQFSALKSKFLQEKVISIQVPTPEQVKFFKVVDDPDDLLGAIRIDLLNVD